VAKALGEGCFEARVTRAGKGMTVSGGQSCPWLAIAMEIGEEFLSTGKGCDCVVDP